MICKHVKVVADRIIPSISKVIKNISRDLLVQENKSREEQERLDQEADDKLQQALPHEKGKPVAPRPTKAPKPTPPQKALTQMQGPSPQEVQRRQDLLQKEEDRLMDLVMKPIEETKSVEDMQGTPNRPAKPKKPERSGLDMSLKPGQKVRTRQGVI